MPTASKSRKKPQIGDQRTMVLTGADWKAHHRETNRLLGLFWDFIDRVPTVLALFYRNDLSEADWGEVVVPTIDEVSERVANVQEGLDDEVTVEVAVAMNLGEGKPKKRKGRTTSVSIMTSAAVKKMGKAWVVLPTDAELLGALAKRTIFDIGLADVTQATSTLEADARAVLTKADEERRRYAEKQAAKPRKESKPKKPRQKRGV